MDIFSSEYGWKTKEILELTLKEINWRLKAIGKRHKSNFDLKLEQDAAIHGVQLKNKGKYSDDALSKKQENALDKLCPLTE